jgi:hypothetical protein
MIVESLPGGHITRTQLEQCQDLTKIVCDRTLECSHHRGTRRTGWQAGAETRSHQFQCLRNFHDQFFTASAS